MSLFWNFTVSHGQFYLLSAVQAFQTANGCPTRCIQVPSENWDFILYYNIYLKKSFLEIDYQHNLCIFFCLWQLFLMAVSCAADCWIAKYNSHCFYRLYRNSVSKKLAWSSAILHTCGTIASIQFQNSITGRIGRFSGLMNTDADDAALLKRWIT